MSFGDVCHSKCIDMKLALFTLRIVVKSSDSLCHCCKLHLLDDSRLSEKR